MKKTVFVILTIALLCAMPMSAFAASPITSKGGSDSAPVKGTYVAGGSATVYSVDIAWGSMEFTYTDASEGVWDPQTHTYSGATEAAWTCADGANSITVTNHSNAGVTAALSFEHADGYNGISGTFTANTLVLETAVGTERDAAPSKSAELKLSGALTSGTEDATIGTVTVTLG